MPIVSVIVPVYNTEKYMRRCLESILSQTYTDLEVILVDDGSTDKSGKICDEYAQKDTRVKVIHKKNEGVSKARIEGYSQSTGDYIVFVDSDDFIADSIIEVLLSTLQKEQVDLVSCLCYDIVKDKIIPDKRSLIGRYEKSDIKKILSKNVFYDKDTKKAGLPLYLCAKMFKKSFMGNSLSAGLNSWYGEDQLIILTLLYKATSVFFLGDYLYYYVHYDNQVTSKYRKDKWDEYYNLWSKLLGIDKNCYLKNQLPHRMWDYSVDFYYKSLPYISSYKEYKKLTKHIFESYLLRQYVFKKSIDDLPRSKFERLFYYLLKYKLYLLLYIEIRRIKKNM